MGRVECEFQYSGVAALLVTGAAAATIALAVVTPMPWTVRAWVAAAVACAALEAVQRVARRRGARGVRAIRVSGSRDIELRFAGDRWIAGTVRDGSFVAPWLTIVLWRPDGAWIDRAVVILPDMVGAEEFRRLRVLLRWA